MPGENEGGGPGIEAVEPIAPPEPAAEDPEPDEEAPQPLDSSEIAPPSITQEKDPLYGLTQKQKAGGALGSTQQYIRGGLESGKYNSNEEKARANKALEYGGKSPPEELSPALKETVDLLREMRDSASDSEKERFTDVYTELTRNMVVVVDGEAISLEDFEKAREDAVVNGDQARIDALDKGIYGFKFETSSKANTEIDRGEKALMDEIENAKKNGLNIETRQNILGLLRWVREMNGRGAAFLKYRALIQIQNVTGIKIDEETLRELEQDANASEDAVREHLLVVVGLNPEKTEAVMEGLRTGNIKPLIENGVFQRTGVEEMFFGKELTDKEREAQVKRAFEGDPRYQDMKDYLLTHKKQMGMMLLMLLYMGMTSEQVKKLIGLP